MTKKVGGKKKSYNLRAINLFYVNDIMLLEGTLWLAKDV